MRVTGSQREDLRDTMSQQLDPNDEAVQDAVETVITLQESGTLDDLAAAANVVSLVSEAVDEDMVQSTTRALVHAGELLDSAAGDLRQSEISSCLPPQLVTRLSHRTQ
ncbi:hypothetical protein [Haloquadratum walsbyi]|uniref:Uncharacterized protein n=1 Tax=Haloquadratum walsbyi J07HQW2 TaxID=1238425 RepID=U1PUW1_9EURY|nr:hypothetical protein [Haloquadratum walsbyi]ERG96176.1 MAG: hypothetical protein J07HQW2_02647 [Haloquadratum walsbyi J07HQW2]